MPRFADTCLRLRLSWGRLLKELSAFGIVGAACVVIDLGVFQLLYVHAGAGAVWSKLASTVVSTTVAYYGQRRWAFGHRARTGLRREYFLFFAVNGVTLPLSLVIVAFVHDVLGQDNALVLQAANVGSIALGTVIRYLCYRRWVFVAESSPVAVAHRMRQERRLLDPETQSAAA